MHLQTLVAALPRAPLPCLTLVEVDLFHVEDQNSDINIKYKNERDFALFDTEKWRRYLART